MKPYIKTFTKLCIYSKNSNNKFYVNIIENIFLNDDESLDLIMNDEEFLQYILFQIIKNESNS